MYDSELQEFAHNGSSAVEKGSLLSLALAYFGDTFGGGITLSINTSLKRLGTRILSLLPFPPTILQTP